MCWSCGVLFCGFGGGGCWFSLGVFCILSFGGLVGWFGFGLFVGGLKFVWFCFYTFPKGKNQAKFQVPA